ncbi:MAG: HAD family hydrolase [Candidatus Helarchaeales archaeon]
MMAIDAIKQKNVKTIIFDWDGTIFNNVSAIHAATESALERYNIDYPTEQAVAEFISLMEKMETNALPKVLLQSYQLLNEVSFVKHLSYTEKLQVILYLYSLYTDFSKESRPFIGTEHVLEELSKKYNLALLTNSKRAMINDLLKKFNLDKYFVSVLSLDDVERPKPDPEGIHKVLFELDNNPEEVIYVGDLLTDLRAAKAANVSQIIISSGLADKESLIQEKPSMIVDHITDLVNIFDLPKIDVDKELDFKIHFEEKEKLIKRIVKREFLLFDIIEKSIPKRLDTPHVQKIARDPMGFLGAIFQDMIEYYAGGEIDLREEFEFFTGFEDDLLKSLGLIVIHFVNERSDYLIQKIFSSKYRFLNVVNAVGVNFFDFSFRKFYPEERKREIQNNFLRIFRSMIPESVVHVLAQMHPDEFMGHFLDGCTIALRDLGMKSPLNLNKIKLLETPIKPINSVIRMANNVFSKIQNGVREFVLDVLENDIRQLPVNMDARFM